VCVCVCVCVSVCIYVYIYIASMAAGRVTQHGGLRVVRFCYT